jgi:hypothetical protein
MWSYPERRAYIAGTDREYGAASAVITFVRVELWRPAGALAAET